MKVKPEFRTLVNCCLQEVREKHQIDLLTDKDLNEDYHLEITLTVKEIRDAAKLVEQPKHLGNFQSGQPEDSAVNAIPCAECGYPVDSIEHQDFHEQKRR